MSRNQGKAYIVTGPTSRIGRAADLALAQHGMVGRSRAKLDAVKAIIEWNGHAEACRAGHRQDHDRPFAADRGLLRRNSALPA